MARITAAEKARNRQRILAAAERRFRREGLDAVGIADLMGSAGLTHGGFYNHFASKEALAVDVLEAAFSDSVAIFEALADGEAAAVPAVVAAYLSPEHRDDENGCCPSASLVGDTGRHGAEVQHAYARGIAGLVGVLVRALEHDARERGSAPSPEHVRGRALGLLSAMVGAMVMARAVQEADPDLSADILATVREQLLADVARDRRAPARRG